MNKRMKWISVICIICLIFSSCGLNKKTNEKEKADMEQEKQEQQEKEQESKVDQVKKLNQNKKEKKQWNPEDICKASLDSIVNKGVYTGFSEKQREMLEANGFIIMEPNFDQSYYLKMHQNYEHIDYSNGSVIITTDSVLNMWHVFYSESMKAMEISSYLPAIQELTIGMEQAVKEEYKNAPDALDSAYARMEAFFHVANLLLNDAATLDSAITGDAMDFVKEELANIDEQGPAQSRLFDRKVDYSQFKVRGHYTQSPELTKYFKGMMWYGLTGFNLEKNGVEATLISNILLKNPELMKLWQAVYKITTLYSGESDDILVTNMKSVIDAFSNENIQQALANTKGLNTMKKAVEKLPSPRIVPKLSDENKDFETEKTFKFMGQRFSVDAYIMQNLMEPVNRPIPTSFDVFTAMGSEAAGKFLRENYMTNQNWPAYDENLAGLSLEYISGELTSGKNFYNGWIRALDHTLNYQPEGSQIPYFMTTPAYEYKKLNSALGSFAELKHDNILYSKQAVAEMGGPEPLPTLHYIEPNVGLYQELFELSAEAEKLMMDAGVDEDIIIPLKDIKEWMEAFVDISKKELNGEEITNDDLMYLRAFGGMVDRLYMYYNYVLASEGYSTPIVKTSALVADVATILENNESKGGYVEVAVGLPYEIYALCHVNGVDFLAKGAVYSSFEFMSDQRLTDEEWRKQLGLELKEDEYNSYYEFNSSNYEHIRELHMKYFNEFSTGEPNQVTNDYEIEVQDWPKLKE